MRMMLSMPPGHAKALAIDTPIPTPTGWTTMGALKIGDQVFDEEGAVCNVIGKSPVFNGRLVYDVTTDTGDTIVADKEHEWLVRCCQKRGVYKVKTTEYLAHKGASKRVQIAHAKALQLPDVALPIDPYVLGYWLGDGSSAAPEVTVGNADYPWVVAELQRLGMHVSTWRQRLTIGLLDVRHHFTALDLLKNKHIPDLYMRSSAVQRKWLLQGLIDSDGHVHPDGQVSISQVNHRLSLQLLELVRTLGVKASWNERRAMLNGKDCGPTYEVSFYMAEAARIPRKAALCRDNARTPGVYIDVRLKGFAQTQCIEVDSKSHLFLAGRSMTPTHNSRYCSVIYPAWYMGKHPRHKYMQGGYGQEFVEKNFGMKVKGIIESPDYAEVFPGLSINSELKANGYWGLVSTAGKTKGRALGEYVTRGVGQGISGFRSNCTGIDDPYANRKEAESPAKIKEVYDWFSADVTPRLLPKSPIFIVATRWTTRDLCATIEEWNKEGKGIPWEVINLPALAVSDNDILQRAENEPLWPDFYDQAHLQNLRSTLPPRDWNSLYQGSPVDEEGGALKGSMIHTYEVIPPKDRQRRVVISVDTANKTNQRADYSVVTVWIESDDRKHYLIDVKRRRVEFTDLIKLIEDTARQWGASAILIEDKGAGTQYIQTRSTLAPAPVIPIEPGTNSKEFRFDAVTPMFEAGLVLLPKNAEWLPDYVKELMTFPGAAHDDQVDSTSQYLSWSRAGRAGGTRKLFGAGTATSQQILAQNSQNNPPKGTINLINGG